MINNLRTPTVAALFAVISAAPAIAEGVRFATFNVSLYGQQSGEILKRLRTGDDPQAQHLAEIIQRVRPDVLLLNEIDFDPQGEVLQTFCEKYLAVAQNRARVPLARPVPDAPSKSTGKASGTQPSEPIKFPYHFTAQVNTGRHSGFDLDRSGSMNDISGNDDYAADCWGYGRYDGQYGLAILSKFPIDEAAVRTFRKFRWKDMPGAQLPDDPATSAPNDWYPAEAMAEFPLSSKSHWDVPVMIEGQRIHVLASHPTPPVFDGPEDRNGRRNHDEIRFWADYISFNSPAPSPRRGGLGRGDEAGIHLSTPPLTPPRQGKGNGTSPYIYDDAGRVAHLAPNESFVILGDLNGDPHDGDGPEGIGKLLAAPRILKYPAPASKGAVEQSRLQAGANQRHRGDPKNDTCDPADDPGPGNLRIDYVLPSADLATSASCVFWPAADDPLFALVGVHPFPSSDHRLVWVDVEVTE